MKLINFLRKLIKTIPLLVSSAEQYMKDGKITTEERKPLVIKWIKAIAESFDIKINPIVWLILSFLVDWAARKLPSKDIIVPPFIKEF